MSTESLFAVIYLLGVLFTLAVTAKPVRRIMGADRPGDHADEDSARDARTVIIFALVGVAMLWPITLAVFLVVRLIPASAGDDEDEGAALVLAGPE